MINEELYISYGKDIAQMTYELMREANVREYLNPKMNVVLKPNLVVAKDASLGATTHPEVVDGIIKYLTENNITDITIAEGSWVGVKKTAEAFRKCGYYELIEKYKSYNVRLFDTKDDEIIYIQINGEKLGMCRTVYDADYLINIPVLKGHCQTKMTCCLKNMKGCIPDSEKRRYHAMGLTKPIALLNCVLKPDLHIVDSICGDLDFEEGGNPVKSDRIILGFDPVLIDSYGAELLGYKPEEIGYLQLAQKYGAGKQKNKNTLINEFNSDSKPKYVKQSGAAARLGKKIEEKSACSACYANLIYALDKTDSSSLNERIKIGQGYRGAKHTGIGVGNCTRGCDYNVPGCPPTAVEIIDFLNGLQK